MPVPRLYSILLYKFPKTQIWNQTWMDKAGKTQMMKARFALDNGNLRFNELHNILHVIHFKFWSNSHIPSATWEMILWYSIIQKKKKPTDYFPSYQIIRWAIILLNRYWTHAGHIWIHNNWCWSTNFTVAKTTGCLILSRPHYRWYFWSWRRCRKTRGTDFDLMGNPRPLPLRL